MKIENTVAFVTGANRGIGQALVAALLASGVNKVYAGVRDLTTVNISNDKVVPIAIDVTEPDSIKQAARDAADTNLLINNAGVLSFGDILNTSESEMQRAFSVNFYGTWRTAAEFSNVIASKSNGVIVNVLTLLSLASMPGMAAYNASKAAAWSLNLSLRATLKEKNIDVVGVFPGAVDTDMLAGVDIEKTAPEHVAASILTGLKNQDEDIFPDPMSQAVYRAWCENHKAVEKQFAEM